MNLLPEGTFLGELELTEVFDAYDGPRLFSAKNRIGVLYVAYFVKGDAERETWLYSAVSNVRLRAVRTGEMPIRDAFLKPEEYVTLVELGRDGSTAKVLFEPWNPEMLPPASDRLALPAAPPSKAPSTKKFALAYRREVVSLRIHPAADRTEAPIGLVGKVLLAFQKLLEQFAADFAQERGPVSHAAMEEIREAVQMNAVAPFAGSFGMLLASTQPLNLFDDSAAATALDDFVGLLDASENFGLLRDRLYLASSRTTNRYREFLLPLVEGSAGIQIHRGSVRRERGYERDFSLRHIRRVLEVVDKVSESKRRTIDVTAKLTGGNLRGSFELEPIGGKTPRMKGKVDKSSGLSLERHELGRIYRASVLEIIEPKEFTGEEKVRYFLRALDAPKDNEADSGEEPPNQD